MLWIAYLPAGLVSLCGWASYATVTPVNGNEIQNHESRGCVIDTAPAPHRKKGIERREGG